MLTLLAPKEECIRTNQSRSSTISSTSTGEPVLWTTYSPETLIVTGSASPSVVRCEVLPITITEEPTEVNSNDLESNK